jgi:anti-sigma regulatory factor (Ser/Thr protein kinase)
MEKVTYRHAQYLLPIQPQNASVIAILEMRFQSMSRIYLAVESDFHLFWVYSYMDYITHRGQDFLMGTSSNKRIDLTIPILQNMELAATRVAEALAEVMLFDEVKRDEVSMALLEACINSFEHSKSKDRKVYITFTAEEDRLKITLRDHGGGFQRGAVVEPKLEEKLKPGVRKRGWGLKLMESLMDEVEIVSDKNGTTVTMIKKK